MSAAVELFGATRAEAEYTASGLLLCRAARSVMFEIGDWWNNPPEGVDRLKVVRSDDWKAGGGLSEGSCHNAGWVARRWPVSLRHERLSFDHHRFVAKLPDEQAVALLQWCAEDPDERSSRVLASRVKQLKRDTRETELGAAIEAESYRLGVQRFGVIYADPPWRFEPRSRISGMDRAPENHYPTMTQDELAELELPAADDCVLFCWATVAMMPAGLAFLSDHGFAYRSAYGWIKPGPGLGYWSRSDQLELLLVGTRGNPPAPAPGTQPPQTLTLPRGRHSEKPDAFAEMIVAMYPSLPRLEMFARKARADWERCGAEAG